MHQQQTVIGRKCSTCVHVHRDEVELALLQGEPVSVVSRRFGLSSAALRRHLHQHAGPALKNAVFGSEGLRASELLDRVLDIADDARGLRMSALEAGNSSAATRAGDAELRALDALTRRLGVDDTELIEQLRALEILAIAVGRAARKNPAVATEVAASLRRLGDQESARDLESLPKPKTEDLEIGYRA